MKEYCNPIDLAYKFQHYGHAAHREAADPTLVHFKGRYYLFASMSCGFYHSDDLVCWDWHENRNLDMYHYAPDVRQIGDWLYFCASDSRRPSTIWRSSDPLSDVFEKVAEPFAFWDPDLFCDDDGRIYLYWGCGNVNPIYGIELAADTLQPIGEKVALLDQDHSVHGWERFNFPGKENVKLSFPINLIMAWLNRTGRAYMEGAYMTKHDGRYYLQYAAPGTEYPVYADGYYIADQPLGPFRYAANNPFSYKPAGFINGAGHGSSIEDEHGNLWHAATMRISVNQNFERRIGLFPAGFDEDGLLYCNQNFADYPMVIPDGRFDARKLQPHYMLLSYKKKAEASSSLPGHGVELALNEDIRSWWCATGAAGEWYQLDLGKVYPLHSVQINFAEQAIPLLKKDKSQRSPDITTGRRYTDSGNDLRTRFVLEGSTDGAQWSVLADCSQIDSDRSHPYIVLPDQTRLRHLRVGCIETPYNSRFAISGLRVFGLGDGARPRQVLGSLAEMIDPLTCRLEWLPVEGALGYNVRFGITHDKLYSSCLVYEATNVLLTTLNAGQTYWICIDSFNENGLTEGVVQKLE